MTFKRAGLITIMVAVILWVAIATVGRLIPHIPNATPLASLTILSAVMFRKHWAVCLTLVSLCLSDILLSQLNHTAIFGEWTLFTYSGYALMALCASQVNKFGSVLVYMLYATLGYWVWTNVGTWLGNVMYPLNWQGFMSCYFAGLPFLRNAFLGNLVYSSIFWFALQGIVIARKMLLSPLGK